MKPFTIKFYRINTVAVIVLAATLFSCKNDIEEVQRVNKNDTIPSMYTRNVSIAESESGHLKYILTAPVLYRYETKNGATIKFPDGFKVVFFDSLHPEKIRTEITANYGINKESERIMEAKSNVVVTNHLKGEQLNTEHLVWNQNTKKIYSDIFVKITTPDKILYGDGMESDENFYRWIIRKPRGEMYVKDSQ
ncbi:MAG: LPS export ABC transporter periplasmic protein LptC [Lentimicrobiaceae bacterium]